MPNTVVKLINAESTWLEAAWEDRKLLIKKEKGHTEMCVPFSLCLHGRKDGREGDSCMGAGRRLQEWLLYMRVPGILMSILFI